MPRLNNRSRGAELPLCNVLGIRTGDDHST